MSAADGGRRVQRGIALLVGLLALAGCRADPRMRVSAWVTSWALPEGLERAARGAADVSEIYFFSASLTPAGRVALAPAGCCREAVQAWRKAAA